MDRFDCYFFDFDGTLADTEKDLSATWKKVMALRHLECADFDHRFRVGPLLTEMSDELFPDLVGDAKEEVMQLYRRLYVEDGYPLTELYPGVREWLNELLSAGKKLFIATNKYSRPTEALLRKTGLTGVFQKIYAPDSFPGGQLLKKVFLGRAIAEQNCDPARCVMIGDTLNDLLAGRANGLKAGMVEWGYGNAAEIAAHHPDIYYTREPDTGRIIVR